MSEIFANAEFPKPDREYLEALYRLHKVGPSEHARLQFFERRYKGAVITASGTAQEVLKAWEFYELVQTKRGERPPQTIDVVSIPSPHAAG